jgi:hypothetical protein
MASTINATPDPTAGALIRSSDTSANLIIQTSSINALSIDQNQDITLNGTGVLNLPTGTTAQRPANPVNGMIRYNTDTSHIEGYINSSWINII